MIGKTISHYKIIEKIGEGGMGIVYKTLDLKLDRFVALKFLPPHLGRDSIQKQRFIQEAKAASALDHPNICTIYEIDNTDPDENAPFGQIFIALAYYEGHTLQERITSNAPLPVTETIGLIIQIAQGLQKAHEEEIIHRDIKPANIIVTSEGDIKIVDFGLAKLKGQDKITKEESTLGTITYMSPEQTQGAEIDARTDIWSLGIIFYEMLTGKSPFDADYDQAVIYNILNALPEPVQNLNKDVPLELDAVVQKCLEKDRDKRYQTIKDFFSDLLKVIKKYKYAIRVGSGDLQLTGLTGHKHKLKPALSAAVILILICVITALFLLIPENKYTSYEEAFFERQFNASREKSENDRTLENVKAHRYYILSTALANRDTMPKNIKHEYHDLLAQNPYSPEAHYYMGLMNFVAGNKSSERDSVWILFDKAQSLGMDNIYLTLDMAIFYQQCDFTQEALELVNKLLVNNIENPDVLFQIGSFYQHSVIDTSRARNYYEKTLNLYDNFLAAHLGLCQLALNMNDLNSARINLENAEAINSEDYKVINTRIEIYEREGNFNRAEDYLKSIINSFGSDDVRYYKSLVRLYQKQDLFEKCEAIIVTTSEKFPSESYFVDLKKSLQTRKEWLKIQGEHERNKNLVQWSKDFGACMEKSVRERKPVLIEFYATNEFWSKTFEENIYPDQKVQKVLKSYIPLKINGEIKKELANKYQVTYFPGLVILNENGEKLGAVRYWKEPPGPSELIDDLNQGLVQYQRYLEGSVLENRQTTEVSNIEDAMLLAKSKQMPIMAIVLSRESKWSDKLVNETLINPLLQSELKKVILVKVDQAVSKDLIKKWDIKYFPTIVFIDNKEEILYQAEGYHTPNALSDLIIDLNVTMNQGQNFKDRIRWRYNLEEAKSVALLQKKDILIYGAADWCPFCEQAEKNVFSNPLFIESINRSFVPIELNDSQDRELLNSFGITAFPTLLILDASLAELARIVGIGDTSDILAALNLDDRKPIYSILGPEKYEAFYKYENLSDKFYDIELLRSVIQANQKQLEIYPAHWQSYRTIGKANLILKNPEEATYYFNKAIDLGAEINEVIADDIMNAYLQVNDVSGFENWIRHRLETKKESPDETVVLYNIASEFYDFLKDRKSTIETVEN